MCGIVAAHAVTAPALSMLLDGLARLEYRGYDSAGVAMLTPDGTQPVVHRALGSLENLTATLPTDLDQLPQQIGIGHTRWATHGAPVKTNAHPHQDCTGSIAVVHNGTIDNGGAVRQRLTTGGHRVVTPVDTEVIAHLLEDHWDGTATLEALVGAVAATVDELEGSWALAVTAAGVPGVVIARRRSPLLVARTTDAVMAASDLLGFGDNIESVYELGDNSIAALQADRVVGYYDAAGIPRDMPEPLQLTVRCFTVDRNGEPDFTAKEIAEQPAVVQRLLDRLDSGELLGDIDVPIPSAVRLIACGSSAYAAQITSRALTVAAGIPSRVVTASEAALEHDTSDTWTIAFSQSGETADVLAATPQRRGPLLVVTNTAHSTLARSADAVIDLACGPEIGVAATKSFTAQVVAGAGLALAVAAARGRPADQMSSWRATLNGIPDRLAATDALSRPVAAELAADLAEQLGWIYISRGAGVPYAYEGALKLTELAYRWTEALSAGELKHGPIALAQPGVPVVVVRSEPAERLAVNISELAARGGTIVTVGGDNATLPVVAPESEPPWGPLEAVVALQHLARETTRYLGHNVDRPRNLAKSVTVE